MYFYFVNFVLYVVLDVKLKWKIFFYWFCLIYMFEICFVFIEFWYFNVDVFFNVFEKYVIFFFRV